MYYRVHVLPDSKHDSIEKIGEHRYQIKTKAPAEDNQANHSSLRILAREVGCTPKELRIISGHHTPRKLIERQEKPLA